MGKVYSFDQAHWSTMRMVQEARKWCEERNQDGSRSGSIREHTAVLKSLIAAAA
jgi:hypothetical protein